MALRGMLWRRCDVVVFMTRLCDLSGIAAVVIALLVAGICIPDRGLRRGSTQNGGDKVSD